MPDTRKSRRTKIGRVSSNKMNKTVVVEGDKLSFDVEGGGDTYTVKVVVKGKELAGTFTGTNGAKGTIKGTRE